MSEITLKGKTVRTNGHLPETGSAAPDFRLAATDLSDMRLPDVEGSRILMNIFPSLETTVCAESVRRFNEMANRLDNTKVLCISRDLAFAHERFNTAEGIDNVISLSEMRNMDFGEAYGIRILDGPFEGLLARAVVVLDENMRVIHAQLVPEIDDEPDYEAAVNAAASGAASSGTAASGAVEAASDEFCTTAPSGEHARLDDDQDCDEGRAGRNINR